MTAATKAIEVSVQRRIPALQQEVFDAWFNPAIPGAFGHDNEQLIVDLKAEGLWYWRSLGGTPHYGRFVEIKAPSRVRHTWMSPNTLGNESMVTVTFQSEADGTLVTIAHAGLPNDDLAQAHDKSWNSILGKFANLSAGKLGRD